MSRSDQSDADYRAKVRQAVATAIDTGANTLTDLCRAASGAFPTLVVDVAREVCGQSEMEQWPHRRWPQDALGTEDEAVPSMPEPHPIDYEWRYTAETADQLAEALLSPKQRIACFGTPSVFVRIVHRGGHAILVDRNPALRRHFDEHLRARVWTKDLAHESLLQGDGPTPLLVRKPFDAVLLDPPWYVDHTKAWMAHAIRLLRPGGRLLVTLFPELVRPSAAEERNELLALMESIGIVQRLPFAPRYTTPVFESETLGAFGLADLGQWRAGELVEIVIPDPKTVRFEVPTISDPVWERVQLGRQVVAVRHDEATRSSPISVSAAGENGSFLLRSVSARDPVRRQVNIWTSRNRAAMVTGTDGVLMFLRDLAAGATPKELIQKHTRLHDRQALTVILALVGW